jgi:hypothetical protein
MGEKTYSPLPLDLARSTKLVSVLVRLTVAFGIAAPVTSFTMPVMAPWSTWANIMRPEKAQHKPNTIDRARNVLLFTGFNWKFLIFLNPLPLVVVAHIFERWRFLSFL